MLFQYNKNKIISKIAFYIINFQEKVVLKERIIQLNNDQIKCFTTIDTRVKRLINALQYLFNNLNQPFNEELLKHLYFLLTNTVIDYKILKEIVLKYYENYSYNEYYLVSIIHLLIINNLKDRGMDLAFLVSEYIMIKKKNSLLIPMNYLYYKYSEAIKLNNISFLARILLETEHKLYLKKTCTCTKEEICKKIYAKKNIFLEFKIKKLYMFGSFAKGTNNKYSDVDFLVLFDDTISNYEKNDKIVVIKQYLKTLLQCDIDVLDFSFALKEFGENEMEHIISLI